MKYKLMYNPRYDLLGILATSNLIKVEEQGRIYMVLTSEWIEVGEL